MSRTITDEKIKLSITIDGNSAQKSLYDLEKATRKLNEENRGLLLQKKTLESQGKKDTDQWILLTESIKKNNLEIIQNKNKMSLLQSEIGLTGLSINQLNQKATILRMTLKNLIPGSADYDRYKSELAQVTARLGELNGKAQQSKFSLSSMADGFNKYQGLALSFLATLTGVVFSIQKIIDINGKLSDAQADVMKTTGMTKKEVDELTKSFGLLQTRTSRIDLLNIAEQGGRIGILKEDIGDFVNVMNKASVSLGDSFTGGAEEVANKLGKIKFLFEETKTLGVEEAYNSIGSAINDLGANGVASEANIAEFTTRIGSLTDVLKPTIQETLALGTAFEESGIEAEVSARAYNIFMKQASTESAKFAKVMGISQQAVENMINTNPLDFMMKFAEGMRGMDATKTAKTLDYLGVNADGANKVIGAMGNNIKRFRELIDLSNNSFESGTSLINEYNIKNETLGATLDKIGKKISGAFSSEGFINWLSGAVNWFAKFVGATEDADGSVTAWKQTLAFTAKMIVVVTTALITNAAWQKIVALTTKNSAEATWLYNIATKARAVGEGIAMVVTQAYAATTMLLTGNLKGAAQAFRVMTATMMTTPWGFIISAIAAVGAAYVVFSEEVDKVAKQQQMIADIHAETAASIFKEKTEIESLVKVANNEFESKENRLAAIKRLNEISPEYLGNLTLENIKTSEGKKLLDAYIESLQRLAYTKSLNNKLQKIEDEKTDIKTTKDNDVLDFRDKLLAFTPGGKATMAKRAKAKRDALLKEKQEEQDLIQKMIDEDIRKNPKNYVDPVVDASNFNVPDGEDKAGKKDPNKTKAERDREALENERRYQEEMLRLKRQGEDDRVAAMADGYQKELEIERLRYEREIEDLEKQKVHNDEMAKLDVAIAKAKKDNDTKYYDFLIGLKQTWRQRNVAIDDQINQIEIGKLATHKLKLGIIEEKAATESIKKAEQFFRREQAIKKTQFLQDLNGVTTLDQAKDMLKGKISEKELNQIATLEEAKATLQRQYNKEEEQREIDFLNETLQKLDQIVNSKEFEGIDLTLMTPEQRDNFFKMIEEMKLKIAELKKAMNGEDPKKEKKGDADSAALSDKVFGQGDIFGYTAKDWETAFGNLETTKQKMTALIMVVDALKNAWGMYDQAMTAKENAQLKKYEGNLNIKKTRLKQQLESGLITQNQYNKAIEVTDKELDRKKLEVEYKQAKRKRAMALADVVINTAKGVMAVMSTGGGTEFADFGVSAAILSGLVIATGAVQAALILKEPLPSKGYEDGLYPEYVRRTQDGKVFKPSAHGKMKSGLYSKPTFLVGEGPGSGPEMIIDKQAYANLSPETRNALVRELQGVRGFENGYYNAKNNRIEVPASGSSPADLSQNEMMSMMMVLYERNIQVLEDLRDNPITALVSAKDWKSIKELQEAMKALDKVKDKAKK